MAPAGEPRRVAVGDVKPDHAIWLPTGDELLFSTSIIACTANLWRVAAKGGEPELLAYVGEDGVMPTVARVAGNRGARLVYVHSTIDENIWRIDLARAGSVVTA